VIFRWEGAFSVLFRVASLAAALVIVMPTAVVPAAERRPNIIFIMVDDLGPEWISCYGAQDIKTPAIDRLAAEGMRFTAAYSMPKCTPTRTTLLTGQYPFRHGWVNHWDVPRWGAGCHFDPKHNLTFARLLKKAGYKTAIAGKWQINDFRVQPNVLADHGFDQWCMWTGFETGNSPSGKRYWDPYIHTRAGSKTYPGKFGPKVFTDFIIDFMGRHRAEPMMIYFPMALTHGPLVTTPNERSATTNLGKHKAMVRYVDHVVDRLVKATQSLKIADDTILIFTTDNGTAGKITGRLNGRKVRGGKGTTTERGCWQPFIVYGPSRVPRGIVTNCLTDFTDMLPTFCELSGVEIPPNLKIDGRSIAKVILGKKKDGPRKWIMAMGGGVAKLNSAGRVVPARAYAPRAIRDKRYKVLINEVGKPSALYDLQRDPGETDNLLGDDLPQAAAAMTRLVAAANTFPKQDAAPRYDPTPAQRWDRKFKPGRKKRRKKSSPR
jgi:arylsulfatase A-like enzyme